MSTHTHPDDVSEVEQRKRTKEVYEAVVRAVDYNSGRKQPPLAKQTSVIGTLHTGGYGRYGLNEVHKAITAACRNGDLFRARDARGDVRLGIDDVSSIAEKLDSYVSCHNSPRTDLIVLANQRLGKLGHGIDTKQAVERGRDE